MIRITIDDELKAKLQNCTVPLDLCDEDGYVLGRLEPVEPEPSSDESQADDLSSAPNDPSS